MEEVIRRQRKKGFCDDEDTHKDGNSNIDI